MAGEDGTPLVHFDDSGSSRHRQVVLKYIRPCLAEFVATALFVFLGSLSLSPSATGTPETISVGAVHGLTIALLVAGFGGIR